jgi:hypothetical protein
MCACQRISDDAAKRRETVYPSRETASIASETTPKQTRLKRSEEENRAFARDKILQKKYGVDLQWYKEVYDSQGGVCAICGQPETKIDHRTKQPVNLSVDHDHSTGQIRRLLCWRCNATLGKVEDSPELLWKMIMYLKAHGAA